MLSLIVAAAQCAAIAGAAFAATRENGQPCPPECVTDSMEIVTWYPSPYNEYEELRLYPIAQSNSQCDQNTEGLMYYNTDKNQVLLCKETGTFTYGWTAIGGGTSGNYSTADRPICDAYSLGAIIFDTDKNKPYVCTSGGVYKPLDSDYDEDGITDAVDYNDKDANDATAVESDVVKDKTFYSGGSQPKARKTGTLEAIKGVIVYATVSGVSPFYQGCDSNNNCRVGCGSSSSGCYLYVLYSSEGNVEVPADYSPWFGYSSRPFKCRGGYERQLSERPCNCMPYGNSCSCATVICE